MFKKIMLALLLLPGVVMFAHAGAGSGGTLYNPPRTSLGAYAGSDYIGYKIVRVTDTIGVDITTDTFTLGYGNPGFGYTSANPSTGAIICPCNLLAVKWSTGGVPTDFAVFKDTWQSVQGSSFTRFDQAPAGQTGPQVFNYVPQYMKVYNSIPTNSTNTAILQSGFSTGMSPSNGNWVPVGGITGGGARFERGITYTLNTSAYLDMEFMIQEIR